ncbi:uncharacterized protein [Drosophila tropicalis]|uniref:uncharacterized protein isoform X1 n=1 Tax=Drosophila tropicalis TaxID=46794 RepID=UPI0035AC0F3B
MDMAELRCPLLESESKELEIQMAKLRPNQRARDPDPDGDREMTIVTTLIKSLSVRCRRQVRRKTVLGTLLMFIFCYFVIGRPEWANVIDLNVLHAGNYLTVHHQSTVEGMDELNQNATMNTITIVPQGYLVYSNYCKIEDLDPYKAEVMRYFKRAKYKQCQKLPPLTHVKFDAKTERYVLSINGTSFRSYKVGAQFHCCYMSVERLNDTEVNYTKCERFKGSSHPLERGVESIIVKCTSDGKQIYINGHAMIPEKTEIRERLNKWKKKKDEERPLSVLMIGIDSLSRVHLIRAMPKTAQYLYDNDWFEMAGYNKIDDNTYPNIMAMSTGWSLEYANTQCPPWKVGGLDKCKFIWKMYEDYGFATAYGEDAVKINTFNYMRQGFVKPPVDYYLRPYLTAAEKLLYRTIDTGMPHCLGYSYASEHIYDYALEFSRRYLNDTYFGFFWTNTHSHSDMSQTSSMDDYMVNYMQQLVQQGTMENSVVVFFSDHGLRFGPARSTWSGHYEERLPTLFFWLPKKLRQSHPDFVQALKLNRNRLTTPYDLHMTLKHILTLSGRVEGGLKTLGPSLRCPVCQSLLTPVSENRNCEEVAIEDHWCTCHSYKTISKNSKHVQLLAKRTVHYINDFVAEAQNGSYTKLCQHLALQSVKSAFEAKPNADDSDDDHTYRLIFYTSPNKALYEATVRHNVVSDTMTVTGSVSRLNMYAGEADCLKDVAAKKYCYCKTHAKG